MQFNVGDRVVMTRYGHEYYGTDHHNPLNVEGVILDYNDPFWRVMWDNGSSNVYKIGTIELVSAFSLENT